MHTDAFELLALSARYFFSGLMLLIALRAAKGAVNDSRRAAKLRRLSPMTGLSGELVVLEGDQRARRGMRYPVIREGMIGSSRRADIRIRHSTVRRRHAFFQLAEDGLHVRTHAGARLRDGSGAAEKELVLLDGDSLYVGSVKVLLVLNAPEAARNPARERAEQDDDLFHDGGWAGDELFDDELFNEATAHPGASDPAYRRPIREDDGFRGLPPGTQADPYRRPASNSQDAFDRGTVPGTQADLYRRPASNSQDAFDRGTVPGTQADLYRRPASNSQDAFDRGAVPGTQTDLYRRPALNPQDASDRSAVPGTQDTLYRRPTLNPQDASDRGAVPGVQSDPYRRPASNPAETAASDDRMRPARRDGASGFGNGRGEMRRPRHGGTDALRSTRQDVRPPEWQLGDPIPSPFDAADEEETLADDLVFDFGVQAPEEDPFDSDEPSRAPSRGVFPDEDDPFDVFLDEQDPFDP